MPHSGQMMKEIRKLYIWVRALVSVLICVLAEKTFRIPQIEFYWLYELCWNQNFNLTAEESFERNMMWVKPNTKFQNRVTQTFGVTIPLRVS